LLPLIATATDDWIRNSDSWLAGRRYVALARLNTQEEIGRAHAKWHDTIVTRDLSALVAL
jgi:hypothetical protein